MTQIFNNEIQLFKCKSWNVSDDTQKCAMCLPACLQANEIESGFGAVSDWNIWLHGYMAVWLLPEYHAIASDHASQSLWKLRQKIKFCPLCEDWGQCCFLLSDLGLAVTPLCTCECTTIKVTARETHTAVPVRAAARCAVTSKLWGTADLPANCLTVLGNSKHRWRDQTASGGGGTLYSQINLNI